MKFTQQDLMDFEEDIVKCYKAGKIRAPIHLSGSCEKEVIDIFKKVNKRDWVFSTHRAHYHALLKSQNKKWLKSEILAGRSLHLNSKKHQIFTSAIVGGNLPIALGVALALKLKKSKKKVWCFTGDMAANMGIAWEVERYARGNKLPLNLVVEDNGLGVYTPTQKVWPDKMGYGIDNYYKYKRKYPHMGIGQWVYF